MQKLLLGFGVALVAIAAMASPAAAATFTCNEVVTGGTYDNVTVPQDGACTLIDSTVAGDVSVKRNAYFEAGNTDIAGRVRADHSLALFIDSESTVGRDVKADDTPEVYVFNAEVARGISVDDATAVVQICGNLVSNGDIRVTDSGSDILVGEPVADCAGNTLTHGDIELERNFADIEFVVRGNTVGDDIEIFRNKGPVEKIVSENTGGDELECYGNEEPFTATDNTGWDEKRGQCRVVLTCEADATGVNVDEVIVPANAACTLTDSTVAENVTVHEGAYFQATNTDIGGRVRAYNAGTLFIDSESTVARYVKSTGSAQVYVFNATIGRGLEIYDTTEVVQICGNTFTRGDVKVFRSGTDILVGSSDAVVDCGGNTLSHGDLELIRNATDVEFVASGNTISDDLRAFHNTGPVEKTITDNTGGDELECYGNEEPVVATGNTGWQEKNGQCRVVLTCEADATGADVDEVVVPANGVCTLTDSTVGADVTVHDGAYFQATNTDVGGKVRAYNAGTLFIDSESTVARYVKSTGTAQVFVFNATIGHGLEIYDTTEVVQVCGNTFTRGDVKVFRSGTDILVGSSDAVVDCAGNTVSDGDMELRRNVTDVEFVASGNTISKDLEVYDNSGPVEKTITDNTGGDELECFGNEDPVVATGNTFAHELGQCIEV
jgi:hypothetical protein